MHLCVQINASLENLLVSKQVFKVHIAEELNEILMNVHWDDKVCRGVRINANDITDRMVAQIEHAMYQDKIPHHVRSRLNVTRRKVTFDLYHELLYNDILSNKE